MIEGLVFIGVDVFAAEQRVVSILNSSSNRTIVNTSGSGSSTIGSDGGSSVIFGGRWR